MNKRNKYTDQELEEMAAKLSGERSDGIYNGPDLSSDELNSLGKIWSEMGSMSDINPDVDTAWNSVRNRIAEGNMEIHSPGPSVTRRLFPVLRIAAAILLLAAIGTTIFYFSGRMPVSMVTVASGNNERNVMVDLPDGSKVWLNRNSELSYPRSFENEQRNVTLKGEAFFEILPDADRPFIIDAGKGTIKVLGTTFNVITNNSNNEIEVLVETGKVMLSDNSGSDIILEPGLVGTIGSGKPKSSLNENINYTAWRTDLLVYEGQKLDEVFADLKRVHNINIIADDPGIMDESLVTVFDKLPQDTIIKIICTTFNLNYKKEGEIYHLSR